ncbi:MAG: histidine triad nucleotide-binding protein [Beggiatoa sp. IS2]|nr:MAG: histidine triad nucleotide-binding protein [Beggiatoa sp. IS2]
MTTEADCLFCKIVAGKIPSEQIYSDDQVIVFKDINPKAPIHLLVVPREHIVSLNEITEQQDRLMTHIVHLLPQLAKQQGLHSGFRTVINTGSGGGQIVFHLHIHLMGGWNT